MFYNISIIIPFYNASKLIKTSLKNSKKIAKKTNIEIIYVDNNSNDGSSLMVMKNIKSYNNIFLYKTPSSMGKGPGVGRNTGTKYAKGKFIIFLDIDDQINVSKINEFLKFIKNNNSNLIYLNKKVINYKENKIKKFSPFLKYNKKNLKSFFVKSNNMNVIFVLFNRDFVLKNKLFFDKGIHEDIFFLFKAHFFNKKKIKYFKKKLYIKNENKYSITNSPVSFIHINGMFNAWRNIDLFLKRKLTKASYNKLFSSIQYRWRGEFANQYNKIIGTVTNKKIKKSLLLYLIKEYKKKISSNFIINSNKDKTVKSILFNGD